jgi:hypothetical protein
LQTNEFISIPPPLQDNATQDSLISRSTFAQIMNVVRGFLISSMLNKLGVSFASLAVRVKYFFVVALSLDILIPSVLKSSEIFQVAGVLRVALCCSICRIVFAAGTCLVFRPRLLFGFLAVLSQLYPLKADVSTVLGGIAPIILGIVLQKPGR